MQQRIILHTITAISWLLVLSCRKNEIDPPGVASLTIINTVKGSSSLVPDFSGTASLPNHYANALQLLYNTFQPNYQLRSHRGKQQLALYNYPDTLPKDRPLLELELDLPVGSIHSLFVTGTIQAPDTFLTHDLPPYHPPGDSTTGIRFVNLVQGSSPVSINLTGQPNGSETGRLAYKQVSVFKNYAATAAVSSYTFEFRDAATGDLLCSYTAEGINDNPSVPDTPVNRWRYRNCTLALVANADDTKSVLLINNY